VKTIPRVGARPLTGGSCWRPFFSVAAAIQVGTGMTRLIAD